MVIVFFFIFIIIKCMCYDDKYKIIKFRLIPTLLTNQKTSIYFLSTNLIYQKFINFKTWLSQIIFK